MNESSCLFEAIHSTLLLVHNALPVSELCSMAGVSRSGYYAWLKAAPARAKKEARDREDF